LAGAKATEAVVGAVDSSDTFKGETGGEGDGTKAWIAADVEGGVACGIGAAAVRRAATSF